ncbi:hypothetical protein [Parabacteroides merdae]|uniref:hypothetical protein n=1 Tax=Parabacteroides merdae TaxID=46503 RepID=UPI00319E4615
MDDRRSGKDKRQAFLCRLRQVGLRSCLAQKTDAQHIADLYAICRVPVLQAKTSVLPGLFFRTTKVITATGQIW